MKKLLSLFLLFPACFSWAQTDSTATFTVSGYVEPYFSYDFAEPARNTRPIFYSHNRHNEVNVNLGYLKAGYAASRVRANAAIAVGTYMRNNYAAEPEAFRNILEMNAGIRLSRKHALWLDLGVMPSHIGFESAVGKDCRALTRSLAAEGSPYFETGAKLSYSTPDGAWLFSALALNGWQRIQRVEGNSLTSFGTQIQYKTGRMTLNSSSFIGADRPDDARLMRYFHDFYGVFQASDDLEITLGYDFGLEEKTPEGGETNTWSTPVAILRYALNKDCAFALRGEYFSDEHGVIFGTGTPNGFKVLGLSLNFDWAVSPNALWRNEFRWLQSKDEIFVKNNRATKTNAFFTSAIAVSF